MILNWEYTVASAEQSSLWKTTMRWRKPASPQIMISIKRLFPGVMWTTIRFSSITIPNSVTEIGWGAFADWKFRKIKNLHFIKRIKARWSFFGYVTWLVAEFSHNGYTGRSQRKAPVSGIGLRQRIFYHIHNRRIPATQHNFEGEDTLLDFIQIRQGKVSACISHRTMQCV